KKGIDTNTQKNYLAELTEILAEGEETVPASESAAKKPDEIAPDGVHSHILLVEDNITALKTLQSMVAKAGYTFQSATTGEDAFSLATSVPFDLIITDIGLPGLSGIELTSSIRQWESDHSKAPTPIIALTGHAVETAGKECFEAGINEILTKPTTFDEIHSLIKKLISEETVQETKEPPLPKPEQSSLGLDLPKSEEELFQLDNFPVFDAKLALKMLDRDLVLLFDSLKSFISDREGDFKVMQEAYTNKDWVKVEKQAHKIKGGLAYIGLERMKYACQYLERYYKAGHRDNLDKLYQQILAVNAQTIEVIKDWLSRYDF
ncbi:MAG: response regulator, partial [Silvanigrellaceae bacterium]|nr:response regulator [Silvanigrellaceae bacterium]